MIEFLTVLVALSAAGSAIFAGLLWIRPFFSGYQVWLYGFMKLMLILFTVPVFGAVVFLVRVYTRTTVTVLKGDDGFLAYGGMRYETFRWSRYGDDPIFCYLFLIWLAGVLLMLFLTMSLEKHCLKEIYRHAQTLEEGELVSVFQSVQMENGRKRKVILKKSKNILSPFTAGLWQPFIVLPDSDYSREQWYLLLRHEYIHLTKRDVFYRQLAAWVRALHWFNPAMYWFVKCFLETGEMACDEQAVGAAPLREKKVYANLLLELAEHSSEQREGKAMASFSGGEQAFKRRLENIMRGKDKSLRKRALLILITAVFVLLCPAAVYASVTGVLAAEHHTVGWLRSQNQQMEMRDPQELFTEKDSIIKMREEDMYEMTVTRGSNPINLTLSPDQTYWISVETSATISVSLVANDENDRFEVGYEKAGVGRKVISEDGNVLYKFSVSPGSYNVYIKNLSDHTIELSGRISV